MNEGKNVQNEYIIVHNNYFDKTKFANVDNQDKYEYWENSFSILKNKEGDYILECNGKDYFSYRDRVLSFKYKLIDYFGDKSFLKIPEFYYDIFKISDSETKIMKYKIVNDEKELIGTYISGIEKWRQL